MNNIKKDFFKEILKYSMSDTIQVMMANEYLNFVGGRNIYINDEDGLEDMLEITEKSEIVRALYYGDYRSNDTFVRINDRCNIESTDDVWDWVDVNKVIEWLFNGDECDELADAYMILKEDDVADVLCNFQWCFADELDYEHDDVSDWMYYRNIGVIQLCREDWENLHDDFKNWKEQKETESDKTLERCDLV